MSSHTNKTAPKWPIPVAAVCLTLGILLSAQFRSQADYKQAYQPGSRRVEDLAKMLREAELKRQELEDQVGDLRGELSHLKGGKRTTDKEEAAALTTAESQSSRMTSGMVPLGGPGIVILLDDNQLAGATPPGGNPANAILHDDDLLLLVNELRASGAEAIAINDQRLVATSEIRCAGPTILVNKTRLAAPFRITAIGDRDTMLSALKMPGGIIETLKFFDIGVKVEPGDNLTIPSYSGNLHYQFARPIDQLMTLPPGHSAPAADRVSVTQNPELP